MITLYDFISMSDNQRGEITFARECLGDRREDSLHIQLYRIDEFYVEVFYDPVNNRIIRFRPFSNLELLAPYINITNAFVP